MKYINCLNKFKKSELTPENYQLAKAAYPDALRNYKLTNDPNSSDELLERILCGERLHLLGDFIHTYRNKK